MISNITSAQTNAHISVIIYKLLIFVVIAVLCTIAYGLIFDKNEYFNITIQSITEAIGIEIDNSITSKTNAENFDGAIVQLTAKGPQDLYLTSGTEKYMYDPYSYYTDALYDPNLKYYNGIVGAPDALYTKKLYGVTPLTPFIWGNGTRYPKWRYPYYTGIHKWYDDSYNRYGF